MPLKDLAGTGVTRSHQAQAGRAGDDADINAVRNIVGLPLVPPAALRGVSQALESVRDVSKSIDRLADVMEDPAGV